MRGPLAAFRRVWSFFLEWPEMADCSEIRSVDMSAPPRGRRAGDWGGHCRLQRVGTGGVEVHGMNGWMACTSRIHSAEAGLSESPPRVR